MTRSYWLGVFFTVVLGLAEASAMAAVSLNEIMYNPPSGQPAEEFVEIANTGSTSVNLLGWRLSSGVQFDFPAHVLHPGSFLVIAASTNSFRRLYPEITNVVGNWTGSLANSGERVRLENPAGQVADEVLYADEGDWSVRAQSLISEGIPGWTWLAPHDREGRTLERVNWALPNAGQNWAASKIDGGTPGRANSTTATNSPPLLIHASHSPPIPRSTGSILFSIRVLDEKLDGLSARLFYRPHNTLFPPAFTSISMNDQGSAGDVLAGDGVWTTQLPPQPNGMILEFFFEALDAEGNRRTWPPPSVNPAGVEGQFANALLQVDDAVYTGDQPVVRLVLTETERQRLASIPSSDDTIHSRAEMNATLIASDFVRTELRYNVGVRLRGAYSRLSTVPSYRVSIPSDRRWKGVKDINLNAVHGHKQVMGSLFSFKAGLPAPRALSAQVRVNGANLANPGPAAGMNFSEFGSYALLEVVDADWAEAHFPNDSEGNIYFGRRPNAVLGYLGEDWTHYRDAGYSKNSNASENDWSDLMRLTEVLQHATDETYVESLREVANVELWMRYFAFNAAAGNGETTLSTGEGDDYDLYRGNKDPRFILVPHDLDSILGHGFALPVDQDLFMGARGIIFTRFLKHPEFVPIYYQELLRMVDQVFSPDAVESLFDQFVASYVAPEVIHTMREYIRKRADFIRSQIPTRITVAAALPENNGFLHTPTSPLSLNGHAPAVETRSVRVNGETASWTAWEAAWKHDRVALQPGPNRVRIEALDGEGRVIALHTLDLWLGQPPVTRIAASQVSGDTVWARAQSPYLVESPLAIPRGATLKIEPGVAVFLSHGAGIHVQGALLIEGTVADPVWLMAPQSESGWAGITLRDASAPSRITHAILQGTQPDAPLLTVIGAELTLDSVGFATGGPVLRFENAALQVSGCDFPGSLGHPAVSGSGWPRYGEIIFSGNHFGAGLGADVIDFRNPASSQNVLQILSNRFSGGTHRGIRLLGARALVEGNSFTDFRDSSGGAAFASAISADLSSELIAVRNSFSANDCGIEAWNGSWVRVENNTFAWNRGCAVGFGSSNPAVFPARGGYFSGNIFYQNATQFGFVFAKTELPAPEIEVHHSLVQEPFWPGSHNIMGDPGFVDPLNDLRLRPGSRARGAGPNGLDMGAHVNSGASISGEPLARTAHRTATLVIGGPGITHYRYRIDGGEFSDRVLPCSQPLVLSNLANGAHTVEVIGLNSAGVWQLIERLTRSKSWTVDPAFRTIRINEVLALNTGAFNDAGAFPDAIELYNDGPLPFALSGLRLSDDASAPSKFVFPAGTVLGPQEYLVLRADDRQGAPGFHLGFSLKQSGEGVYLFDTTAQGGAMLDSVQFGLQVNNYSIGRDSEGNWCLGTPTLGAANEPVPLGDPRWLRISEWLAAGSQDDFIELQNPTLAPVALGGLHWTDHPLTWPDRHRIAPLSFVGPGEYLVFRADGKPENGAGHLSFKLDSTQGMIGLMNADSEAIDLVLYGPQRPDISQGRLPLAPLRIQTLAHPTPGTFNIPQNTNGDTDGDGMPDAWELAYGLNPLDPSDAAADWDMDGSSNLDEFRRQTNPHAPEFHLAVVPSVSNGTITAIQLRFRADPTKQYALEWTSQLTNPQWITITNLSTTQQASIVAFETAVGQNAGFFRVRIQAR